MRVIDALEEFYLSMEGALSPKTVIWYRQKLESLGWSLGDCTIDEVTIRMLRTWRSLLAQRSERYLNHPSKPIVEGGLSAESIRGHVRACRRFFHWLEEEGYLDTNVAKRLEQPPKPIRTRKGIKVSDRNAIIREAEISPRDYALALFLADTGCRVAGVVGLKLGDLDLENGTAEVFEKGRGGNKKARLVFFVQKTRRALDDWLEEVRPDTPDCDNVFLATGKGGCISKPHGLKESGVYQVLKRLAKRAGVTSGFNLHNWRHGAARGMIKNGASLIEVCQLLGHSSVTVTGDYYGTFDEEELRESHREYSWIE